MESDSREVYVLQAVKPKKRKMDDEDDLLLVLDSVPKENLPTNNTQITKTEKWQQKEFNSSCTKGNKRNGIIKIDDKIEVIELSNGDTSSIATKMKQAVKSSDLNNEPKDDVITGSAKDRKWEKCNDLSVDVKNLKYLETRLDKIPKDVLGRYGIVIEESDPWKGSSVADDKINVLSGEEGEDGDGELIIDEEDSLMHNIDRRELTEKKSNVSSSTKENSHIAGFTNCGHHLVISSVTSLQWSAVCNICDLILPDADSLEIHKKGHCSYPGCLDVIPDESERGKHLQVHNANPSKPFRCDYCRKRFHYYGFTKKHREVCKVLKRSKCPYCSYSSPKVTHFNKHIAKHVNKMTCTDCNRNYIRVKKYAKHMYVHHRKEVWFQCPQCPVKIQQPEMIIKHIQVHKLNVLQCGLSDFIRLEAVAEE